MGKNKGELQIARLKSLSARVPSCQLLGRLSANHPSCLYEIYTLPYETTLALKLGEPSNFQKQKEFTWQNFADCG